MEGKGYNRLQENERLYRIRHSLAHIMAQAVLEVRPGSKLGFGPPIDDGFYYDFILTEPIDADDFKEIEKRMKRIIKAGQRFECEELPVNLAFKRLIDMGEPYKKEYAEALVQENHLETIRFYRNGPFLDMCEGPHVTNTQEIPVGCFKLRNTAGAYWRGDSKNDMMTRIYAWAFESKASLDAHVKAYEMALARDHKKLGRELEIFHIDDEIGRGLPLWLPNGTVIREELERYLKELEFKAGFKRVATPHIAKASLYHKTGHLPYYEDHIFPVMEVRERLDGADDVIKEAYCLKPMNCPHHHMIYASRKRSYRELPLRLAEYGHVYRYEDSGAVSGLIRVRGMCMNDAHIYCTEDQIKSEFLAVMEMHKTLYDLLGLSDYYMRFSTWDPGDPKGREKYVDNPAAWERSQALIYEAMVDSGLPFQEGKGEAAFYGPKIDFQIRTVIGREETASTNQLDFAVPARLNMTYTGSDNNEHMPYVIHRAPAGTHERFVAFLIEHFGGAFPIWLAPVQVVLITVNDQCNSYARKVQEALRSQFVRAELDTTDDSFNKKIRTHTKQKVPCLLIIGEREVADETVTCRFYGIKEQRNMTVTAFEMWILDKIATRARHVSE